MLKTILTHIDFLNDLIELLDKEIAQRVNEYQEDIERLDSIPGIATRMAEQILSEIGTDVKKQFPTAAHSVRGSKNYLGALYRCTASQKGQIRAGIVVAHAMLTYLLFLLNRKEMYVDLGEDYFDKQRQQSIVRHSLRRLESLGYTVTLEESKAS